MTFCYQMDRALLPSHCFYQEKRCCCC
nr:unnamed protein product [Callosobruchus chinensis]